jgi:cytochrome c peroxidase
MGVRTAIIFCFITSFFACSDEDIVPEPTSNILQNIVLPPHFPDIKYPEENVFSADRWLLGKKLFFDKRLSIDSSISCASCHKLSHAFADHLPQSPGVFGRPGTTNSPSLANVAFHPYLTREGGLPTLEMQVLVPIQEHNEFGFNIVQIAERLHQIRHIRKWQKELTADLWTRLPLPEASALLKEVLSAETVNTINTPREKSNSRLKK